MNTNINMNNTIMDTGNYELKGRVINIFDGFDNELLKETMIKLLKWEEEDNLIIKMNNDKAKPEKDLKKLLKPITINIVSPGGEVRVCMSIVDMLKSFKGKIITRGLGEVCSAGFYLFCIGDERIAGKNTQFLYHVMSYGDWGKISDKRETLEFLEKIQEKLDNLVVEKTKLTHKMLTKYDSKDWWLTAEEAKEFDIVTKYL